MNSVDSTVRTRFGIVSRAIRSSLVLLFSGVLHGQELREFRNSSGQVLRGELLAVQGNSVSIKAADGRTIKTEASFFSPDDQIFFTEWSSKNKPKIDYQFKAAFAPKRISVDRFEEGATKVTVEKWAYAVTLESLANATLEKVEVRYRVFKATASVVGVSGTSGPSLTRVGAFAYLEGSQVIPAMTLRKSVTVMTKEIPVNKSDLKGGWVYTNGSAEKRSEDLEGIWIKVFHDGQEVFESVSNPTKFKELTW